jgi:excisionase family DNA binding protein
MTAIIHTLPLLVTIRTASKMLSLGESTVYAMVASGAIPYVPVGRAKRIAVSDIQDWIDQSRKLAA